CGSTSARACTELWSRGQCASRRRRRSDNRSSSSTRRPGVRSRTASLRRRSVVARPGGLGRGLGALIPSADTGASATLGMLEIPTASIRPSSHQPREVFDEEALNALGESIREVGVLQPVLVRETDDGYELIAGERRWRAARRVGLQTVPAIVRVADGAVALQQAIVENVQREALDPLEEAAAYQQLIEDFKITHADVARRVGKSRATVTNFLRLLQLPPTVQRYLHDGSLRRGHAIALLGTPDRAFQEQLARQEIGRAHV